MSWSNFEEEERRIGEHVKDSIKRMWTDLSELERRNSQDFQDSVSHLDSIRAIIGDEEYVRRANKIQDRFFDRSRELNARRDALPREEQRMLSEWDMKRHEARDSEAARQEERERQEFLARTSQR
jgi:hypothetical protein